MTNLPDPTYRARRACEAQLRTQLAIGLDHKRALERGPLTDTQRDFHVSRLEQARNALIAQMQPPPATP